MVFVMHLVFLNPSTRKFSFFSQVHQSYSRIDYIFLDNKLLPYLQDCSYECIVVSDLAPVVLGLNFPKAPPKNYQWSFNTGLLKDKDFVTFISSNISSFLEINSTPGMAYWPILPFGRL